MEALSNIINLYNKNQSQVECGNSEFQSNHIYTSKEIIEKGYLYSTEPPLPIMCQFCGQKLYSKGVVLPISNKVIAWLEHERCSCKRATEYWAQHDKKQSELQEKKRIEEENRLKRERINKILGNSGIGKRFKNRTFENFKVDFENQEAYRNSRLYAENFQKFKEAGEGLYFSGNNGTGKTHLAVAIALYLIKKGIPVICMTSIRLFQEIRRTYDKDRNVSEYELLKAYKEADLLVIDDLGQENITDWSLMMLYDIINDRYENCLPVIITTNLRDEELIKIWSQKVNNDWTVKAIVSRLHEMTMGINMNGRDRRKDII